MAAIYNYANTLRMLAEWREALLTAPRNRRMAILRRINTLSSNLSELENGGY